MEQSGYNGFNIEEELKKLPAQPGVYIMHDKRDEIIYVGKAISLKNRVRQYFQSSRNKTSKIEQMVSRIARFEYIITDSELEALVLECNLIKEHRPRYNTMLKDDKTYPYIKVTVYEDFPRVLFSRDMKKDKSKYFGPYTSAGAVKDTIDLIHKLYKIRTCNRNLPKDIGKDRPCLNYHIKQCSAPCQGYINKEEYGRAISQALDFLGGKYDPVISMLEEKMQTASDEMDFEKAIEYRDLLTSVRAVAQKQKITSSSMEDRDIIAMAKDDKDAVVLVELAERNAALVLSQDKEKIKREELRTIGAMNEVCGWLGITGVHRIEAFDISNISGFESVGSMIVYEDGKPKRNDYRKFKIKWVKGANDYASMREVLTRRFSHGLDEAASLKEKGVDEEFGSFTKFPDLLMMDGGRGQVNIALEVLDELKLSIPVCGMVKDDNHRTRGLYYNNVEIPIDKRSEGFKLITRVQDEAHRFAIEYHRSLRSKGQVHSILDDIPDIGPTRRKALMRYFKDIEAIKEASIESLTATPGMNAKSAQSVYDFFH